MANAYQHDGKATTSFDMSSLRMSKFGTCQGDWLPSGFELCGVLGTLYKTEAVEDAGNNGGAKTSIGGGSYNDDGAKAGFSIVSMN